MTQQSYGGIMFEVPEGWEDKSVLVFAAKPRAGKPAQPNVVFTRDAMPPGQSLRTFAAKEIAKLAQALQGFELVDARERNIDAFPAVQHTFIWEGQAGQVVQRMVIVECRGVVHTVTASVTRAETDSFEASFESVFASVRLVKNPSSNPPRLY